MQRADEAEPQHQWAFHLDAATAEQFVRACVGCAQAITAYADACLDEAQLADPAEPPPPDIAVADLCGQTARLMGQRDISLDTVRRQVEEAMAAVGRYGKMLAAHDSPASLRQPCIEACLVFTQSAEAFLARLKQPV